MTDELAPQEVPWDGGWFDHVHPLLMRAWRGVESQHFIATMKLVDRLEEQAELEAMLEESKPPLPEGSLGLDYLLFTPFRYTSPHPSRFRRAGDPGVWYGADSLETACAELAYWRIRFMLDCAALAKSDDGIQSAHTFYAADVAGSAIDLATPPWVQAADVWEAPDDYAGTHQLAAQARLRGVEWIRYRSVRRSGGVCAAVLAVSALAKAKPLERQEWVCSVTRRRAIFRSHATGVMFGWEA